MHQHSAFIVNPLIILLYQLPLMTRPLLTLKRQ
jgi:hypothetical protein